MRTLVFTGFSLALSATVVGNAFYQKQQFYPSVVYITKSNPSMAVMYIQAMVVVVLAGKLLRALFFGQLRDAEMEHLIERSWYAVTETCLAFTVFRDDFSPRFVALFTLLLFLKCFHWLAEDRIDYMERSPAISWLFHLRALSLIFVLGFLDIMFVRHAFLSVLSKGPSVQLVFGFEYEILFTVVMMIFVKYILHAIDLQTENPWDNKAVYLLYTELVMGLIRVILYVAFVFIMIKVHTFPLFAIRPMYLSIRAFQKAAQDVILSRRAIRNMNTLYPDATPEELSAGDNVCIICREDMVTGCKKLPCNHIFHTSCLRSWFQRQQTCPTCRLEVLRMPRATQAAQQQQQQQPPQPQQPAQPPVDNQNPFNQMPGMFGGMPFQWPPAAGQAMPPPPFGWPPQQQQQQAAAAAAPAANATPTSQAPSASPSASPPPTAPGMPPPFAGMPGMPPFFPGAMPSMPSMPFMPPMMPPMFNGFPPPPMPMAGLSPEELKVMEGVERDNVEARVQWLRDIQALLDGAMLLINQYNSLAQNMGSPSISVTSTFPHAQAPPSTSSSSSSPTTTAAAPTSSSPLKNESKADSQQYGQGARPKYTSSSLSAAASSTHTTDSAHSSIVKEKECPVEGAVGGSTDEEIPKWDDPREEEHTDEMHEVRKRRIQHFSQQLSSDSSSKNEGQEEE